MAGDCGGKYKKVRERERKKKKKGRGGIGKNEVTAVSEQKNMTAVNTARIRNYDMDDVDDGNDIGGGRGGGRGRMMTTTTTAAAAAAAAAAAGYGPRTIGADSR